MITAYVEAERTVKSVTLTAEASLPDSAIWVDILQPSEAEREAMGQKLGLALPTTADMHEIEATSRTYTDQGALFVTAPTISTTVDGHPKSEPTTFIIDGRRLTTLRLTETGSIDRFAQDLLARPDQRHAPADLLIGLIGAILDRLADLMELLIKRIEVISAEIFRDDTAGKTRRQGRERKRALQGSLRAIGRDGRMLARIRSSLTGFERVLGFLATRLPDLGPAQTAALAHARRDAASLIQHADFQEQQIEFLLDATVGLITIEQTEIVRVLSIATTIFLPPTLIASLYGMNFANMPELSSPIGYPLVLIAMLISVIVPLWYFRRKGWM